MDTKLLARLATLFRFHFTCSQRDDFVNIKPQRMMALCSDLWVLVFEQLAGDHVTLCNISLVSRAWRTLSWPSLLEIVDLSLHNIESPPTEPVNLTAGTIYSPMVATAPYRISRSQKFVSRQHNFLHLITTQPALAKYVKSFTWTLVWGNQWREYSDESTVLDNDRETWNVFTRLVSVTRLDLASFHHVCDAELVRQNPAHFFPNVTDLRLFGWMHRGLVKAIITTIDISNLRSLKLDYLEEQGGLPGGRLLRYENNEEYARNAHRAHENGEWSGEPTIDDELFRHQETGKAVILPGPMWYALRLLSRNRLQSLRHLRMTLPHFHMTIDLRNYYTFFYEAAKLLRGSSSSLESLVIIYDQFDRQYPNRPDRCGTSRFRHVSEYQPWCIRIQSRYMQQLLIVLSECAFPYLTQITFKGFELLEDERAGPDRGCTLPYIAGSRFNNVDFTGVPHESGHTVFEGFHDLG